MIYCYQMPGSPNKTKSNLNRFASVAWLNSFLGFWISSSSQNCILGFPNTSHWIGGKNVIDWQLEHKTLCNLASGTRTQKETNAYTGKSFRDNIWVESRHTTWNKNIYAQIWSALCRRFILKYHHRFFQEKRTIKDVKWKGKWNIKRNDPFIASQIEKIKKTCCVWAWICSPHFFWF